jgi:hypothetical protein
MTEERERRQIAEASLVNLVTNKKIKCMFNPHEYKLTKSNSWTPSRIKGRNQPHVDFAGGGAGELTLNLIYDTYEAHDWFKNAAREDVRNYTKDLWELMLIDKSKINTITGKSEPPTCRFEWGKLWSFVGVITRIDQTFTLFLPDGTPVRAKVDVTFKQTTDEAAYPRTNPTSGGDAGERVYVVNEDDTLTGIAYAMYGDATVWRHLAEANRIDNPLKLRPGQRLIVKPLLSK